MDSNKHTIVGIHLTNRFKLAVEVQNLFTEYGCHIKTRLGLHDVTPTSCATNGIILVELVGDDVRKQEFIQKISNFDGIEVKTIEFDRN